MWIPGIEIVQVEHFPTPFFAEGDLAQYAVSIFDPGIWGVGRWFVVLVFGGFGVMGVRSVQGGLAGRGGRRDWGSGDMDVNYLYSKLLTRGEGIGG